MRKHVQLKRFHPLFKIILSPISGENHLHSVLESALLLTKCDNFDESLFLSYNL